MAEWHELSSLEAFVDGKLKAKSAPYTLRGRSNGRHPTTGTPAISLTYDDIDPHGQPQRVEIVFVEARPGHVLSATALCSLASRRLWRDGCRLTFGSLRVADPSRPPVTGSEGVLGIGLPPGCSYAMKRLWRLLDLTSKLLVDQCGPFIEERSGTSLGAAAHFEARTYLLFQVIYSMVRGSYPEPQHRQVHKVYTYAITGSYPVDPPPKHSLLARQIERLETYVLADGGHTQFSSSERALIFAELVTTSGKGNTPTAVVPAKVYKRLKGFTPEKECVWNAYFPVVAAFMFAAQYLFRATSDIDVLRAAEVDRRIADASEAADKTLAKVKADEAAGGTTDDLRTGLPPGCSESVKLLWCLVGYRPSSGG